MSPGSRLVAKMVSACKRADVLLILLALLLGGMLMLRYGSMPEHVPMQTVPPPAPQPAAQETPVPARRKLPEAGSPVRFLMYNVQNYFVVGEKSRSRYMNRAKSRKSREAVAEVIAAGKPDIVGLIEIGGEKALEDLRGLLTKRGVEYPHAVLVAREGEDRALALLSRFPIVRNDSRADFPLYVAASEKCFAGYWMQRCSWRMAACSALSGRILNPAWEMMPQRRKPCVQVRRPAWLFTSMSA